jgi:hypothetical protein
VNWLESVFALASAKPALAILILVLLLVITSVTTIGIVIRNVEKTQVFIALVLRATTWLGPRFQKQQKQFDIEGHVNLGVRNVQRSSLGELSLPSVQIEWIDGIDGPPDVRDNVLILRMARSSNNAENITRVAMAVAKDGVIRDAASYVSEEIEKGLELTAARTILKDMGHPLALRRFTTEVLQDVLASDELKSIFQKLETIDDGGLFSRCLLLELSDLTAKTYPNRIKDSAIIAETRRFLEFVHRYALRGFEERSGLDFFGDYISIGFVIVAKQETLEEKGLQPYIKAALHCFGNGADTVYLSAFDETANAARAVAELILKYGHDPASGVPVFYQSGERAFRALYQQRMRDVLLIRLSRRHGTSEVRPARILTEAES